MRTLLTLLALVFVASCGIDGTLKTEPEPEATPYTVFINVQPTTSLRTIETWGNWSVPIQTSFQTNFEGEAAGDHGGGHATKSALSHEPVFLGRSTVEGFGVLLQARSAHEMYALGHDGPQPLPQNGETHHLMVNLEDAIGGHHPHGNANVPGAKVHIELVVDGEEEEIELRPVQGGHGLRYEANAAIPLGVHDLKVHVSPPQAYRSAETASRWISDLEADLPAYDLTSGSGNGSAEVDGLKISVRAGQPKLYGAFGMGHLPLAGDETVNFSVRLEDTETPASGQGEMIGHCWVGVTIVNENTGATAVGQLMPMLGKNGFHYGANFRMPETANIVGNTGGNAGEDGHGDHAH